MTRPSLLIRPRVIPRAAQRNPLPLSNPPPSTPRISIESMETREPETASLPQEDPLTRRELASDALLIFDREPLRTPPICCAGCQFHPVKHRTNLSSPPHPTILSTRRFLIHSPRVPPLQTAARIMTLKERSYAEVYQISPYPADSCG